MTDPSPGPFLPAPDLPAWLDALLPFERFVVPVGPHRIHVQAAGDGHPVLLLHGNPTWSFLWRKVAAELVADPGPVPLRLVMPDLVGLGYSDHPRSLGEHTLENHAGWISGLLDALEEAHGFDRWLFVGQDWGGPIGLAAFARRPERLAGLVLLNTVAGPPKPTSKPTLFHRFGHLPVVSDLAFRLLGFPQVALHKAQGDPDSIRGEVARAYREPLRGWSRNAAPLALTRMVPTHMGHPSVPVLERCQALVQGFTGPSALVWGTKDPILGRLLKRHQRLLPDAPVTETEAGHFLQEEIPGPIAAAVRDVAGRLWG